MDSNKLNTYLKSIIEKRAKLLTIPYSDDTYDAEEDALHDLEDEFADEFGDEMEAVISKVLKTLNSDSDVLHPTAYLPQMADGVDFGDDPGVPIEIDAYEDNDEMDIRLVLIPDPAQLVLMLNGAIAREMWKAK